MKKLACLCTLITLFYVHDREKRRKSRDRDDKKGFQHEVS